MNVELAKLMDLASPRPFKLEYIQAESLVVIRDRNSSIIANLSCRKDSEKAYSDALLMCHCINNMRFLLEDISLVDKIWRRREADGNKLDHNTFMAFIDTSRNAASTVKT